MNRSDSYLVWADPSSPWSQWVKPVLFAFMGTELPTGALPAPSADLRWLPPDEPPAALVVDLPGAEGVVMGIELARRGHRPVPLYNALAHPPGADYLPPTAVDVWSILAHLHAATEVLRHVPLPPDAPPAFLLDANRRTARTGLDARYFDNRSVCFITDFPSTEWLRERGIGRAIVIERGGRPDTDLARVLAEWQAGGITLWRKDLARAGEAEPLYIRPWRWWHTVWFAIAVRLGLRRSRLGGFGAIVEPAGG